MLTAIERKTNDAILESKMFNLLHPIGTSVQFWNGDRQSEWIDSITKSSAFAVGDNVFILLENAGRIPLSRIKVV